MITILLVHFSQEGTETVLLIVMGLMVWRRTANSKEKEIVILLNLDNMTRELEDGCHLIQQ